MTSSALTCACWQPIEISALGVSKVPGWRMGCSPMSRVLSGNGPRCHLPYHLNESGNLESGLLFQGDLIALWHSPGTFKLFKRLTLLGLCCDAGGNIDWPWKMHDCMGVFLFLNISSHACCELLPVPREARHWCSRLSNRYMGWREPDTCLERRPQPLWSCPPWAGHCWQAGCSQRSGASASSCPPASSSAWPSGWVAGRLLHRGHGSVLLAPIVLPKACCWSADRKAISQLRVIGAPFSNWAASAHLQSLLKVMAVL